MSVLLYMLLALIPNGQDAAPMPEKPAGSPACQISGIVVEQEGGNPIKNARAFLEPDGRSPSRHDYMVKTGADGRFCFPKIEAGRYQLATAHNGFVTQRYGAEDFWSAGTVLSLEKEQKLDPILFRLVRAGVISGRILDQDGEPAPGIIVQALMPTDLAYAMLLGDEDNPAHTRLVTAQVTTTDDLGQYRLAGLPSGAYIVNAQKSNSRSGAIQDREPDDPSDERLPTFYPGTLRRGEAESIEVAVGQDATASFQLKYGKTVTVSGLVMGEDSKPVAGAFVGLQMSDADGPVWGVGLGAQTEANGHFQISAVMSGSYIAQAYLTDKKSSESGLYAQQDVEVGTEDVKNLRLLLVKNLTLAGRLAAEGGTLTNTPQLRVDLRNIASDNGSTSNRMDKDGSFTLRGLRPGTYRVTVYGLPETWYLKRVSYGGTRRSDSRVTIENGVPPAPLDLLVSPNAASIVGTVRNANDSSFGGALVVLRTSGSKRDAGEVKGVASSDQNGQFSFNGLAPGSYIVAVRRRAASNPRTEPPHVSVSLNEAEQKAITLKME